MGDVLRDPTSCLPFTPNQVNYHLLGHALGNFDPDYARPMLAPGLYSNLLARPSLAPQTLRHCWAEVLAIPASAEVLDRIDWANFRASVADSAAFWLGFWHSREGMAPEC